MEISLTGRSAIVTGGSKGIGFAIATRFAASGGDVAIVARGREALDEAVKQIKAGRNAQVIGVAGRRRQRGRRAERLRRRDGGVRQGRHHGQQCRHLARPARSRSSPTR